MTKRLTFLHKLCFLFIGVASIFLLSSHVLGSVPEYILFEETYRIYDEENLLEDFEITGGITKSAEVTFDTVRTLVGSAPDHTEITINIYQYTKDEDNPFISVFQDQLTVGASGVFSRNIDLDIGQNFILVTAQNREDSAIFTALITCKDEDIKKELESGIALPGDNSIYSVPSYE